MNDKINRKGFINKEKILEYISEEEIYSLVFGFEPQEFEYTTSPFRADTNPGCWFYTEPLSDKLRFCDFGNSSIIMGIKMSNIDCFDAVQVHYKIPNFYLTLEFINNKLIVGKNKKAKKVQKERKVETREKISISVYPKPFTSRDGRYWSKYGITKSQLISDKVFSILKYEVKNTKNGDFFMRPLNSSYCFNEFNGRKKLYFPYEKGAKRFLTDCIADDVGNLNNIDKFGENLIISKSYKDCRVITNLDYQSVWFQNEGMLPNDDILIDLSRRYRNIIVFFDNDGPGIFAGKKVRDYINLLHKGKAKFIYLPQYFLIEKGVKDPADVRRSLGEKVLKEFLKENI